MKQLITGLPFKDRMFQYVKLEDRHANFIINKIRLLEKDIFFNTIISRRMNISFNDFLNSKYSILNELRERYKNEKGDVELNVE